MNIHPSPYRRNVEAASCEKGGSVVNSRSWEAIVVSARILIAALVPALIAPTYAQQSTEELAKAAQNPVANMVSVPFQNNTNFDVGRGEQAFNAQLGAYYNAIHPHDAGNWQLRFQLALLFPKR
jgi:hypothetical protein